MRVLFLSLILLANLHFGFAQKTGELSGVITDLISGEPLIGASVIIDSTSIGASSDLDGFYNIKNIPLGPHSVAVSYVGYKPVVRYNVLVRTVGNPDLNVQLEEIQYEIEGVVVRPDPFEKKRENPMSVQSLTTEEIIAYPGGNNDIAKVVQSFPGVSGSISGFRNDIIIRGGAPNEVVYYLDGIEIPNINHFATQGSGGGPVSLLNVSFFEGVTLNTSAFSAQYDNALSGVLQFNQRTGNNRKANRNLRISATETALTLEGPIKRKEVKTAQTSYIFSVRRSYLQFLFKAIGLPFIPDYWDFQAKVDHRIDANNTLTFIGLGSIDDFSINVPENVDEADQAVLDGLPIIKQWSNTAGLSWKHLFKNIDGSWRNSLSYNILNNSFQQFTDNENMTGLFFDNDSREAEVKLRSELINYWRKWKLNSGATIQNATYTNKSENLNTGSNFESDLNLQKYGFYGQMSRELFEGLLAVSGGFRFDGNTFTDSGNKIWKRFSPRASLSLRLEENNKLRLNASVGRYYKLPVYTVLGFENNVGENPNASVEYIKSDHYVAGIEYVPRPSTRINVEAFYKKYSDYPVSLRDSVSLANLGGDFEVTGNEAVSSVGLGKTQGIEVSVQQKLLKNYFAIVSFTTFKSEFTGFDTENFLPSAWDYQNLLSFTGGYKFPKNWEIGVKVRYTGKAPYAPVDLENTLAQYPNFVFNYDALGSVRLDPFTAFDVRIDKKWNAPRVSFNVYLDLQNVTSATQPAPPTYGLLRNEMNEIIEPRELSEIMQISDGSLLPSIGVILDF